MCWYCDFVLYFVLQPPLENCSPIKIHYSSEVLDIWTERNLSNFLGQLMEYKGFGLTKELIGEKELTLMLG